jgi:hypothetical protein
MGVAFSDLTCFIRRFSMFCLAAKTMDESMGVKTMEIS